MTTNDDINYREIADQMTIDGCHMNHSTVRNTILKSMRKFADDINKGLELKLSSKQLDEISSSSVFHQAVSEILCQEKCN